VSTHDPSTDSDTGLTVAATLAKLTLALYVGWSEPYLPVSVVWRDQNVSHLTVSASGQASLLAR